MSELIVKFKSYDNFWDHKKFKTTKLKCKPHEVLPLELLLKKSYNKHGYSIIDKYIVEKEKIYHLEFLLMPQKREKLTLLIEPQIITDKVLDYYQSLNME